MMQTELNTNKSGYILMGPRKQIEQARKRLEEQPITCGEFVMKELKEEKWLGDYSTEDLKRSVMPTIRKREAKTRRAGFEILNRATGRSKSGDS